MKKEACRIIVGYCDKVFMMFMKEWKEWRRFQAMDPDMRSIVFYAEDSASMVHFDPIIAELTGTMGLKICYLTSCPSDPILSTKNENILAFYIGSGIVRIVLLALLKADILIMTMPDLETFYVKRSRVHPVHYIYVFHSIVSTHLVYRKGAFNHYDTVFCAGPHHVREIRAAEDIYGLKAKNLVAHGYGRLEALLDENVSRDRQPAIGGCGKMRVLVAPSWGASGLLETRGCELIDILLQEGHHVTVRPHPMTKRKWPETIKAIKVSFQGNSDFVLETDIRNQESILSSHCMISDWSGVALEYAFALERPVIFIDMPRKINNPYHEDISREPIEVAIRNEIGEIVPCDQLDKVPEKLGSLYRDTNGFRERIRNVRRRTVFNIGRSGTVGAEHVVRIANECKNMINARGMI